MNENPHAFNVFIYYLTNFVYLHLILTDGCRLAPKFNFYGNFKRILNAASAVSPSSSACSCDNVTRRHVAVVIATN